MITATVKSFSEGRVKVEQGRVVDAGGNPIKGYDLTREIDEIVQRKARDEPLHLL